MPCPRTVLLSACLDSEWTGPRRLLIATHVQTCPICATELEALRAVSAELHALPSPVPAPDFSHLYTTTSSVQRRTWSSWIGQGWRTWMPLGLTTAASLLLGVGLADLSWTSSVRPQAVAADMRLDSFSPVPPGGLCAAAELCGTPKERS